MKKDRISENDRLSASDEGLKLLQSTRRTEGEVRKHLAAKGYDESEIDAAVEYLISFRYVDDFAYALDYIEMSIGKGRGNMRIRRELSEKGIDDETIEDAFCEKAEEYDSFGDLKYLQVKRAIEQIRDLVYDKDVDDKLLAKISRRLNGKGYEIDIIHAVIRAVREDRISEYE